VLHAAVDDFLKALHFDFYKDLVNVFGARDPLNITGLDWLVQKSVGDIPFQV